MIIGYSCEDSVHRAFIKGLRKKWCPSAELVEGSFRGSQKTSLRREYKKTCDELFFKGADVIIFLTDNDKSDWRERWENEINKLPRERREQIILGLPERNIECWLTCDRNWLAEKLRTDPSIFNCTDPKSPFASAMGITRDNRKEKEEEIANLICEAPLRNWLQSESFENFYNQARDISQRRKCNIENIRNK
jgi:hypothetical protein